MKPPATSVVLLLRLGVATTDKLQQEQKSGRAGDGGIGLDRKAAEVRVGQGPFLEELGGFRVAARKDGLLCLDSPQQETVWRLGLDHASAHVP